MPGWPVTLNTWFNWAFGYHASVSAPPQELLCWCPPRARDP